MHRIDGVTRPRERGGREGGAGGTGRRARHRLPQGTAVEPGFRHGSGGGPAVQDSHPGAGAGHGAAGRRGRRRSHRSMADSSSAADDPLGASVTNAAGPCAASCRRQAPPLTCRSCSVRRAEAESTLGLATRDRERAERLTHAGAAPAKRLDEARTAEEQAKARLSAAETSFAQFNTARSGGAGRRRQCVRGPLAADGVIAQRDAATGANVAAGTLLFQDR